MRSFGVSLGSGSSSSSGIRTMMRTRLRWVRISGSSRVRCPVAVRVAVVSIAFMVVFGLGDERADGVVSGYCSPFWLPWRLTVPVLRLPTRSIL